MDNNMDKIKENDIYNKQTCNNCDDIGYYHPMNLCYNYEPKIIKPISWLDYFKSYIVEIKSDDKKDVCSKYSPTSYDSEKVYCSSNFSFIKPFNNNNTKAISSPVKKNNWLFKLKYIINSMCGTWVNMTNYLLNDIYKFSIPVKYITEDEMKIQNYQMKNQIDDELYNLKHKIQNEFIILNNCDNNYKALINNNIQEIEKRVNLSEVNLDKINISSHKQNTKLLIEDIKKYGKENLINDNVRVISDTDYEKIET